MDMASQKVEKNIKLISLCSGGLEVMELRQSKGAPGFVLHGEIFPQNVSKVMTEFEKILSSYDLNDKQYVLYQITDKRKELSNIFLFLFLIVLTKYISKTKCFLS